MSPPTAPLGAKGQRSWGEENEKLRYLVGEMRASDRTIARYNWRTERGEALDAGAAGGGEDG